MKNLINRYVSLFLLLMLISAAISGCSGNSDNLVATAITQTEVGSPVQDGTATVSFVIAMPNGWKQPDGTKASIVIDNPMLRASIAEPYAKAELYYGYLSLPTKQVLSQVKTASVVDGAVNISFGGIVSEKNVIIRLSLYGCSIYGIRKFEGEAFIHDVNSTVITLHTAAGEGPNKTTDGKSLIEVGQPDYLGRAISGGNLTFNGLGQPIGISYEGNMVNFETGQKYFNLLELSASVPFGYFAFYNGYLYTGYAETVAKVSMAGEVVAMYGKSTEPRNTVSGPLDETIRFASLDGLQTYDGSLYIFNNWEQLVKIKDDYATVLFKTESWHRHGSILDNGDIWVYLAPFWTDDHQAFRISITGEVLEEVAFPNSARPTSAVRYGNGVLFACQYGIYFWDGNSLTEWISPYLIESNGYVLPGNFYIHKNDTGTIYVASEYLHKIWRVE